MPTFGDAWKASDLSKLPQLQPKPTAQQMFQPFPAGDPKEQEPYQWMPPIPAPEGQQPQSQPQTITLFITPRPAERPRFSKFGGAYNSKNYSDYKKRLVELLEAKIAEGQINPALDYAGVTMDFHIPIPKSWTKKATLAVEGKLHRKKIDCDNAIKACLDAMEQARVFFNDGQIAQCTGRKWYVTAGAEPRIELRLYTETDLYNQSL